MMKQHLSTAGQMGHVLAARRKKLNLSQKTVAEKLGISQSRLSELEEYPARLKLDRLLALANILGLELTVQDKTDTSANANTVSEW